MYKKINRDILYVLWLPNNFKCTGRFVSRGKCEKRDRSKSVPSASEARGPAALAATSCSAPVVSRHDGDDSQNAGVWYLVLHVEYRSLEDSSLRLLGAQAWRSAYFAITILIVYGVVLGMTQVGPSLSCL
jgi:hypothetical protein